MELRKFTTDYDKTSDVLYLKFENEKIKSSQECTNDGYIILDFNESHEIVGITFIGPTEFNSKEWQSHPDRNVIPIKFLD